MGNFFSSKPKPKTEQQKRDEKADQKGQLTEAEKAQLELKRARDRLKKQGEQLERVIEKEKEMARELVNAGQKKKAIMILKRKQMQEKMLDRARGQMLNVEQMLSNIQDAEMNVKVFNALKEGNATLKNLQDQMTLDDINDIMDDTVEHIDIQNQISEALGQNLNTAEMAEIDSEVNDMFALFDQGIDPFTKQPIEGKAKNQNEEAEAAAATADRQEQMLADQVDLLPEPKKSPAKEDVAEEEQTVDNDEQEVELA